MMLPAEDNVTIAVASVKRPAARAQTKRPATASGLPQKRPASATGPPMKKSPASATVPASKKRPSLMLPAVFAAASLVLPAEDAAAVPASKKRPTSPLLPEDDAAADLMPAEDAAADLTLPSEDAALVLPSGSSGPGPRQRPASLVLASDVTAKAKEPKLKTLSGTVVKFFPDEDPSELRKMKDQWMSMLPRSLAAPPR